MEEREAAANEVVEHMNTMWQDSHYMFDPRMSNYAIQSLLYNAVGNPADKLPNLVYNLPILADASSNEPCKKT